MASVDYALIFCTSCRSLRKIAPEKLYESHTLAGLDWPQMRALACPNCGARMARAPEYGAPTYSGQAFWPVSSDVEWMA